MTDRTMYDTEKTRDHINRLCDIIELSKVGAAATDTTLKVAHLNPAFCCLFETIHSLASEILEVAEPSGFADSAAKNDAA